MSREDRTRPVADGLPKMCYAMNDVTKRLILIRRGEAVYHELQDDESLLLAATPGVVDRLNGTLGVTPAQREAMVAGSMFGWNVPAADPTRYDAEGHPIRKGQDDANAGD